MSHFSVFLRSYTGSTSVGGRGGGVSRPLPTATLQGTDGTPPLPRNRLQVTSVLEIMQLFCTMMRLSFSCRAFWFVFYKALLVARQQLLSRPVLMFDLELHRRPRRSVIKS